MKKLFFTVLLLMCFTNVFSQKEKQYKVVKEYTTEHGEKLIVETNARKDLYLILIAKRKVKKDTVIKKPLTKF